MSAIPVTFGSGGSGLAPGGHAGTPDLATALRDIADDLAAVNNKAAALQISAADITVVSTQTVIANVNETNGVMDGLIIAAPTTPSVQDVDPAALLDWNVNVSLGYAKVNAIGKYNAAQVDLNISTGAKLMDIGQEIQARLVWAEAGGAVTQPAAVLGAAAADGLSVPPNDAAVTAAVGHANWIEIGRAKARRTADAVVVCTQDASYQQRWGGAGTTLINDLKAKYNIAVTAVLELITLAGTNRTLTNELKVKQGMNLTMENELKADINTMTNALDAITLKTTKA